MTSLIDKALSCVGLMRVAEHEKLTRLKTAALDTISQSYVGELKAATDWEAKFKKAVTDLAAARDEVTRLNSDALNWVSNMGQADDLIAELRAEVNSLRPDALLWRNARDKRAGKRGKAS